MGYNILETILNFGSKKIRISLDKIEGGYFVTQGGTDIEDREKFFGDDLAEATKYFRVASLTWIGGL